ncbi:helix-turn-helix domain-containing protein [Agromyces bauzanensis]|nr:helix-turn-helix domain-containing protein [Agromyces bauzanensis]
MKPPTIRGFQGVTLADLIDICSNHGITGFTPDQLRELASGVPAEAEPPKGSSYQPHALSKRLGPQKVEQIVQAYQAGESARSIATKHGVAVSAVVNLLRKNQVVVTKRRVTDAESLRMADDYIAGLTIRELEKKYDLSHGAVMRAMQRLGIEMRAKAPRKKS